MDARGLSSKDPGDFIYIRRSTCNEDLKMLYREIGKNWERRSFGTRSRHESKQVQDSEFLPALFSKLFNTIEDDVITVVVEYQHVDPIYRDAYYFCYDRQHFSVDRFTDRLVLFRGSIDLEGWRTASDSDLSGKAISACVVNPLSRGAIGRTLVGPEFMMRAQGSTDGFIFRPGVRVSDFKVTVLGRSIHIKSFPYRQQDEFAFRCAEISAINLCEYYANEFNDYRSVSGSDILQFGRRHATEREFPSRGLSFEIMSKFLASRGFAPCSHASKPDLNSFRRALFTYAESGIPTMVILYKGNGSVGHAMLCVGRGGLDRKKVSDVLAGRGILLKYKLVDIPEPDEDGAGVDDDGVSEDRHCESRESSSRLPPDLLGALKQVMEERRGRLKRRTAERSCVLYNMADMFSEAVVMDDNQLPFALRDFEKLSLHDDLSVSQIIVPMHRSMLLDAAEAERYACGVLEDPRLGIARLAEPFFAKRCSNEDTLKVVFRLFMASTRGFKRQRVSTLLSEPRVKLYEELPLPHFVWVCELYLADDLSKGGESKAFGEYVLDATAGANDGFTSSIVICSFPGTVLYRAPEQRDEDVMSEMRIHAEEQDGLFWISPYENNLMDL